MNIWLVRSSLADPALPEPHRFLTAEGRRVIRALGNKIRLDEQPTFDRFFTSTLPTCLQTAELFADRVDYVGVIEVLPSLVASTPPQVATQQLLGGGESIAVIADEPYLSTLGAYLIGRPTFPPLVPAQVSMITDRKPAWCLRPGDLARQLLLVA